MGGQKERKGEGDATIEGELGAAHGFIGDPKASAERLDDATEHSEAHRRGEKRFVELGPHGGASAAGEPGIKEVKPGSERKPEEKHLGNGHAEEMRSEKKEQQGSDEIEESADAAEVINNAREMHEALLPGKARNGEWICGSEEGLQRALSPAGALLNEFTAFVGGHAGGKRFVQIFDPVTGGLELDGSGPVLGNGFSGDTTDREESGTTNEKATAVADDGVEGIAAWLKSAEEKLLLILESVIQAEVARDRIFIEEVLGSLNHGDLGIAKEADGALDEIPAGNEIGVEADDEFTRGERKGMVEIAGLGMTIVRASEIFATEFAGERAHGGTALIVEEVNGFSGIIDGLAADDGAAQHLDGLGIGGNEDIDAGHKLTGADRSL